MSRYATFLLLRAHQLLPTASAQLGPGRSAREADAPDDQGQRAQLRHAELDDRFGATRAAHVPEARDLSLQRQAWAITVSAMAAYRPAAACAHAALSMGGWG